MTLRELLKKRDRTQMQIAAITGLSQATISRAVRGYPVQRSTLIVLCHYLDYSLEELEGYQIYNNHQGEAIPNRQGKAIPRGRRRT